MPGNNSSRTRAIEPRYSLRPPGQRGILGGGLPREGPGRPPFWRTPEESCKGLGSVTFKINTQHTHTVKIGVTVELGEHLPLLE